MDLFYKLQKY